MHKLIEIPIYALDKNTLSIKYENYVKTLRNRITQNVNEEIFRRCLDIETYPQRVWEYNHIVGYVAIGYEFSDILFKIYLPASPKQRYIWRTSKKTFLCDMHSNGMHFRVNESMSNYDIQYEIADMLNSIIKEQVPKKYYVDRQAFDNVNRKIDYLGIINNTDNK